MLEDLLFVLLLFFCSRMTRKVSDGHLSLNKKKLDFLTCGLSNLQGSSATYTRFLNEK